jgi:hypothetical protein
MWHSNSLHQCSPLDPNEMVSNVAVLCAALVASMIDHCYEKILSTSAMEASASDLFYV